ncbi:MAG TPA: hypothetical protein VIL04_02055, partial [Solirubrobacterales bacterium]
YWPRGTAAGALASVVMGGAAVLATQWGNLRPLGLWPGVWGLAVSSLAYVGVSLLTRPAAARARDFVAGLRQPA